MMEKHDRVNLRSPDAHEERAQGQECSWPHQGAWPIKEMLVRTDSIVDELKSLHNFGWDGFRQRDDSSVWKPDAKRLQSGDGEKCIPQITKEGNENGMGHASESLQTLAV
jgi:hypothetical protein